MLILIVLASIVSIVNGQYDSDHENERMKSSRFNITSSSTCDLVATFLTTVIDRLP